VNHHDRRGLEVDTDEDGCVWDPETQTLSCTEGQQEDPCNDPAWYQFCNLDGGWGNTSGGSAGNEAGVPTGGDTQGAAAGPIQINNWTSTSLQAVGVENSLRWIESQIGQYTDCDKWLSGNGAVIDTILNQGLVGVGNFGATPGTITNAVAGVGGTNLTNGALLTVNLSGAYFSSSAPVGNLVPGINGGSDQAKLFILLHELAHLTQAANFQPGDNTTALQNQNNSLLLNNCGDFIASVKN
jgi:hypothetical protein